VIKKNMHELTRHVFSFKDSKHLSKKLKTVRNYYK